MNVMHRLRRSWASSNKTRSSGIARLAGQESGFTLLEVIIAMAIMVIALASILSMESSAINASAKAKTLNVVTMLARARMIDTEYMFEGKTFEEVKPEDGGTFDAPYQDYRWTSKIKEVQFPNLVSGAGNKKEGGSGGEDEVMATMGKLVTNFLSKAVREVNVTVYWKKGSGEQSYTLTTYWVDLNHEFSLSE